MRNPVKVNLTSYTAHCHRIRQLAKRTFFAKNDLKYTLIFFSELKSTAQN
jgi:hypothetical protein